MITMQFGPGPAADVRFAVSALAETANSIRLLGDPAPPPMHGRWLAAAGKRVAGLDLDMLRKLLAPGRYAPDFVHPLPSRGTAEFGDEITTMLSTPPDLVAAEISAAYPGSDLPPALRPFRTDPQHALGELARQLRAYWERAVVPYWPQIRALLEADVLYRACQMAGTGWQHMLAGIDPGLSVTDSAIRIRKDCCTETIQTDQRGLLFLPSVFAWPSALAICRPPWPPAVVYPARGIGTLGHRRQPAAEPLGRLLGQHRAAILTILDQPLATTHIASKIGITPGGVSQHLTVLRDAGLVTSSRAGRFVLYQRTQAGDTVVGATRLMPGSLRPVDLAESQRAATRSSPKVRLRQERQQRTLRPAPTTPPPDNTVEQKLTELDDLHDRGVITDQQWHEARSKAILGN